MASGTSWLGTAKQSLDENGFFELQDFEVGERIKAFQSRGFPYGTVYALEFIETVIFDPVSNIQISPWSYLTATEDP